MSTTKTVTGKKVLYLGSDTEYLEKLEIFYKEKLMSPDSIIIHKGEQEFDNLFNYILDEMPHLIILDLSNKEVLDVEKNRVLFQQIHFLKRNKFFKGIAVVSLFASTEQSLDYLNLISCGVNYFFVKGAEDIFSLLDSCYIGFEQNIPVASLAKARELNLPYMAKSLGVLSFIGQESLVIESDLELSIDSTCQIDTSIVEGNFPRSLTVAAERDFTDYYFFNGYEFDIPFCGAWDEPSEQNIEQDSYETWLEFNKDNFELYKGRLLFSLKEKEALESIYNISKQYPLLDIHITPEMENAYVNCRPSIIFIQLEIGVEGDESIYGPFISLVNYIKGLGSYEPLIVLFSSPSTKEALEKTYMYNKLVVSSLPYTEKLVSSMLEKLSQKFLQREDIIRRFPIGSPEMLIKIDTELKITSLTERHITFYAEPGIPMYSLLYMEVPLNMLVTVVPQVDFLPSKGGKEHYLGLINGISSEDRQVLRRFVNFLIHKKPKEFAWEDKRDTEDQQLEENIDSEDRNDIVESHSTDKAIDLATNRDIAGDELQSKQRGRKYEGKSKL